MMDKLLRYGVVASLFLLPLALHAQGLSRVVPFSGTADTPLIVAIQIIINVFLMLAAIVAAIFIIIGGVWFITSAGDEGQAEKGKKTLLYAVIGLIAIGLSAAIVNFVIDGIAFA
ncbi:MAG: hypothetical protein WEC84_00790 [Candidatus Andersenbacteria bacterium]